MRVLFVQEFVSPHRDYKASDAVGYGITAPEEVASRLMDVFSGLKAG